MSFPRIRARAHHRTLSSAYDVLHRADVSVMGTVLHISYRPSSWPSAAPETYLLPAAGAKKSDVCPIYAMDGRSFPLIFMKVGSVFNWRAV